MFELVITPRFSETDALGHISNVSYPVWFEQARMPIFKLFTPDLDPKKWQLILASIHIDFKAQAYLNKDITVNTGLKKIGASSMVIQHNAYQSGVLVASGEAVMVQFDFQTQKSMPLSLKIKAQLSPHLIDF